MVIHAYQEIYLNSVQSLIGNCFDIAINTYHLAGQKFIDLFSVSSVSKKIENGEAKYLVGKSSLEIFKEIILETTGKDVDIKITPKYSRSSEYWIGWAVSYYQWYSDYKYIDIFNCVKYKDLEALYPTLHEADISKFVQIVDSIMKEKHFDTNLKRIRNLYGISQSKLAKLSGVSLRSIQMYEQRNKNINKASALTLLSLSKVLGCSIEDLIEKEI